MRDLRFKAGMGLLRASQQGVLASLPVERGSRPRSWDPTAEFSFSVNPSGVWSYGALDGSLSVFELSATPGTQSTLIGWVISSQLAVCRNVGAATFAGIPPGFLSIHPMPTFAPGCLRWTAPADADGPVRVVGQFFPGDSAGPTVAVRRGGSSLFSAVDAGVFDLVLSDVREGEAIDFAVYGVYFNGSTPLSLQISGDFFDS